MTKPLKIIPLEEAADFLRALDEKARNLFIKAFDKTAAGFTGDWFSKMSGTNGIWEFRVDANKKFYRMFAFWDGDGEDATLILCTHAIEKKKNKTPPKEIKKAEQIKKEYFSE
ncbi:MAG: type II toxin-antitoxin system RelE/ParE family toxin [Bacteroidota bacterium]